MNNEYIIVNKTTIEERIAKLENIPSAYSTIKELKQILSQSTPLIDEIEKAFDEGFNSEEEVYKGNPTGKIIGKKEYLSNLKLDI